ncbi:hypothetical protein CHGG_09779 [Chaetomium globosum CBS 148.51]|uniref:Nephrocystin 3-like N-terminal domain-containing protein n=1 Tax=Chaetomium globosum (strain ATCC 6205 / CBS 148.51 / DSM 1962 / NBRC 6347 / NRRL 1970) TaxID=306901 RepID=Q2GQH5_CHAGB|nr:uncharacterized protein CHGG_09779 [Chaetomium globosum CBS 148.51]EAQ83375.1 hypothetical protein CHGG_09779 [Chaetomium globosum CBS 148.51]
MPSCIPNVTVQSGHVEVTQDSGPDPASQKIKRTSALNTRQLAELIKTIKTRSDESEGRLSKLKEEVAVLQHSQIGLLDGLDRLHLRQDNQDSLEERSAILNWLAPVDYSSQQRDFIRRRQEGTGKWLLESEEYQAWLSAQGKTLFCPGIPGAGKTSLASIVIDDLSSQFAKNTTINLAYIYCNFQRQNEQNVEGFLTNLLKQLVECQSSVKDLYEQHRTKRPSLHKISAIFHTVISISTRVFVVVDAIDECQESDGCRNKFLSELFDAQARYRINLLVTSRFIPDIVDRFRDAVTLEIRASSEDVERYIEGHLDRLRPFVQKKPPITARDHNRHIQFR